MKVAFFDTHPFERVRFEATNQRFGHELTFFEPRLTAHTAALANGFDVACSFANDRVDASALKSLKMGGVRLVALRSAGFNHVDLLTARDLAMPIVRVPAYSPYAVAEHAMALILTLNRKIYRAYNRVREGNFSLEGLVGFDLHGKTIGVLGTGRIGAAFCRIALGFGAQVLAYDLQQDSTLQQVGVEYVSNDELFTRSDILSLHVPLTAQTKHVIDAEAFSKMKKGVMLINTGRGALINAKDLIAALKSGKAGFAGLDVYEEEEGLFFSDHSTEVIQDDVLARLLTFPNVVVTAHQGFLTEEALSNIASTTLQNISDFENGLPLLNAVTAEKRP